MLKSNSGQVSETATWIIATLVIIFILMISVYGASKIGRGSTPSIKEENQELLTQQSFHAYLLTKNSNGTSFYNQISLAGRINSTDELIIRTIFEKIYGVPSSEISLKLTDKKTDSLANLASDYVNLDEKNFIELKIKLKVQNATI